MDAALDLVTRIMTTLGDAAFAALSVVSPAWALVIISAITGVAMLLIWRYTSNQKAIADVRNKISANLLATRLFKDNLSVTFRAQRQIIWQSIRLLGYSFRPMMIMLAPFVLVMVQFGLRYEHRPAAAGEVVRVTAVIRPQADLSDLDQSLVLPDGVLADPNDPCRVAPLRTLDWRLTPTQPGEYVLLFQDGQRTIEMPLITGGDLPRVSVVRGGGFWDRLLYSAEPSIPAASRFEQIRIGYPNRSTPMIGLDMHWLITLLVLSIVFALIFKPILKVHI